MDSIIRRVPPFSNNNTTNKVMLLRRSLVLAGFVFLLVLSVQLLCTRSNTFYPSSWSTSTTKKNSRNDYDDNDALSIRPGSLPSYTGWPRSERTLAPFFRIVSAVPTRAVAGTEVTLRLECTEAAQCATAAPAFYVRAYGPSVITGQVTPISSSSSSDNNNNDEYNVVLRPTDPGNYHVEIILTFSKLPDLHLYPLADPLAFPDVSYEGYHVSGSPLNIQMTGPTAPAPKDLPLCKPNQLLVTVPKRNGLTSTPRARWRVTEVVNHPSHQRSSVRWAENITLQGYQQSLNSLGVVMDYQFEDCRLMPEPVSQKVSLFQCVREPIHVIMIGDSNFRLQEKLLQQFVAFNPQIRVSFLELYGGYFRTQILTGPHVTPFLTEAAKGPERRVVLFNTGLHDIHRLCGIDNQMRQDRLTYLRPDMPSACIEMYKIAIDTLARDITNILPATDIKIFQTSTSAWHKYGNYGVSWDPRYGQPLPMDSAFVEYFNQAAVQVLQQKYADIAIVDGFYVSHARPDHREVDDKSAIGKKLSHPGLEVISAITRMWSMVFLEQVCH